MNKQFIKLAFIFMAIGLTCLPSFAASPGSLDSSFGVGGTVSTNIFGNDVLIDSKFLPGKMWQGTWDPEGILSTFPAFVTAISGMLVGRLLLSDRSIESKTNLLFFSGFISVGIGIVWSWFFGLNNLLSLVFCLVYKFMYIYNNLLFTITEV